jgi:hypothetical protein
VLWEIPSFRVVLGMIMLAVVGYNWTFSDNLFTLYMFSSIPAGWYVINRILDWIIPRWNTDIIIIWRLDILILLKAVKNYMILAIKLLPSFLIGWVVAPYFLYQAGRDITLMVKNKGAVSPR